MRAGTPAPCVANRFRGITGPRPPRHATLNDQNTNPVGPRAPDALERLRDRTDELELIISSLTTFALFSLPGWLFDAYSQIYTQLSTNNNGNDTLS